MSEENSPLRLVSEDFKITPDFTPEVYQSSWSDRLSDLEERHESDAAFNVFYNHVWNLLFAPEATEETRTLAIALLKVERPDAAFLNPFAYNDWIRTVREEVIKQGMSDFWKKEIIPNELGLLWARDSDYFDDMEDPEPAQFYKLSDSDPEFVWKR